MKRIDDLAAKITALIPQNFADMSEGDFCGWVNEVRAQFPMANTVDFMLAMNSAIVAHCGKT